MTLSINPGNLPRYIAVEGPIGVGKTSLTKKFAETFNYETVLEAPEEHRALASMVDGLRRQAESPLR